MRKVGRLCTQLHMKTIDVPILTLHNGPVGWFIREKRMTLILQAEPEVRQAGPLHPAGRSAGRMCRYLDFFGEKADR